MYLRVGKNQAYKSLVQCAKASCQTEKHSILCSAESHAKKYLYVQVESSSRRRKTLKKKAKGGKKEESCSKKVHWLVQPSSVRRPNEVLGFAASDNILVIHNFRLLNTK